MDRQGLPRRDLWKWSLWGQRDLGGTANSGDGWTNTAPPPTVPGAAPGGILTGPFYPTGRAGSFRSKSFIRLAPTADFLLAELPGRGLLGRQ